MSKDIEKLRELTKELVKSEDVCDMDSDVLLLQLTALASMISKLDSNKKTKSI